MGALDRVRIIGNNAGNNLRSALTSIRVRVQDRIQDTSWISYAEVAAIFGWSIYVGRIYVNLDPFIWPLGGDFPLTIEPLFVWNSLSECGSCVLWNGLLNGGYPSFVEAHAPILHPLAVVTTLIFGVINGAKLTIVASFFVAGVAQWWLGRELGLGWLARLWAAAMAVVGVHLSGKMEMGLNGVILSTAFAALVIPATIALRKQPSKRTAAILAITLSLTWLAGQGYLQIALAATLALAMLAFGMGASASRIIFRRRLALSLGLSFLLAAVFLVPFIRFFPSFGKFIDPNLEASQPLAYVPLNFIIRDYNLLQTDMLGKIGFPAMYLNFIGWTPILLAIWGAHRLFKARRRTVQYFVGSILMLVFMTSDEWSSALKFIWEQGAISIRYPPLFLGLAVPFILALASMGIDDLMTNKWPKLEFGLSNKRAWELKLIPAIMLIVAPLSIKPVYEFGQDLMKVHEIDWVVYGLGDQIDQQQANWVRPLPDHYWRPFLLTRGIKLTEVFRPWSWKDRNPPSPTQFVTRVEQQEQANPGSLLAVVEDEAVHYAYVQASDGEYPCRADSQGGSIDINCDTPQEGRLVVMENSFSGWRVWRDGKRATMIKGRWLSVRKPAGEHIFQFRYRPLDVPFGVLLSFVGVAICTGLIIGDDRKHGEKPVDREAAIHE